MLNRAVDGSIRRAPLLPRSFQLLGGPVSHVSMLWGEIETARPYCRSILIPRSFPSNIVKWSANINRAFVLAWLTYAARDNSHDKDAFRQASNERELSVQCQDLR
jgi:hypothetical protein